MYFSICCFSLVPCLYCLHHTTLWLVQPNWWWDAEHQECLPCRCSPRGSVSQRCDVEGHCVCRPGFVGRHCDLRRQGYERRETRRPVERIPMESVQQRWGGLSRTGGCPRGAYRPQAGVTHTACGWRLDVLSSTECIYAARKNVIDLETFVLLENRFKAHNVSNIKLCVFLVVMVWDQSFKICVELFKALIT